MALPNTVRAGERIRKRVFGAENLVIYEDSQSKQVFSEDGDPGIPKDGGTYFHFPTEKAYVKQHDGRWFVCSVEGKHIKDIQSEAEVRAGVHLGLLGHAENVVTGTFIEGKIKLEIPLIKLLESRVSPQGVWQFEVEGDKQPISADDLYRRLAERVFLFKSLISRFGSEFATLDQFVLPRDKASFAAAWNELLAHIHTLHDEDHSRAESLATLFQAARQALFYSKDAPLINSYLRENKRDDVGELTTARVEYWVDQGYVFYPLKDIEKPIPRFMLARIESDETRPLGESRVLSELFEDMSLADLSVRTLTIRVPETGLGGTCLSNIGIVLNVAHKTPPEVIRVNELVHLVLDTHMDGIGFRFKGDVIRSLGIGIPIQDEVEVGEFLSDVASLNADLAYAREQIAYAYASLHGSMEIPPGYRLTIAVAVREVERLLRPRIPTGELDPAKQLTDDEVKVMCDAYMQMGKKIVAFMREKGMFKARVSRGHQ